MEKEWESYEAWEPEHTQPGTTPTTPVARMVAQARGGRNLRTVRGRRAYAWSESGDGQLLGDGQEETQSILPGATLQHLWDVG